VNLRDAAAGTGPLGMSVGDLGEGEIHVWIVRVCPRAIDTCRLLLSEDEAAHSSRFLLERHQRVAVVSRGFRRIVLARYARVDPRALIFTVGPHGKPSVGGGVPPTEDLRFNVSHSGGIVALAVARGRDVGIDVESFRQDRDLGRIALDSFSARELTDLSALPASLWTDGFYRCWVQKEAFVKLLGDGLSFPLDCFDVDANPTRAPRLLDIRAPAPNALPCSMALLASPPGYVGVVAVRGLPPAIRSFLLDAGSS
jgi:4'-phosphopantetheinyl transferase